jgi:hypothetical protein
MNKQEAIERVNELTTTVALKGSGMQVLVDQQAVLEVIDQINEPEKPVVPKFVAEWIDEARAEEYSLYGTWEMVKECSEIFWWLFNGHESNQDTFARAWLDGYEIGQEKLYMVEIADVILTKITRGRNVQYKMLPSKDVSGIFDKAIYSTRLTEQEIKQKDERLWQFAKEVE